MTTYRVYSIRRDRYGYTIGHTRKGLTLEEARALREERMANPNRKVSYTVVAESRTNEFFAKVEEMTIALRKQLKVVEKKDDFIMTVEKQKKWKKMDEMYAKGYRVYDAIDYLNR